MKFLFLITVVLATFAVVTSTREVRWADANQQCQSQGRPSACNKLEPRTCKKLRCLTFGGPRRKPRCTDTDVPALDGTPCGPNDAECSNAVCRIGDEIVVEEAPQ